MSCPVAILITKCIFLFFKSPQKEMPIVSVKKKKVSLQYVKDLCFLNRVDLLHTVVLDLPHLVVLQLMVR